MNITVAFRLLQPRHPEGTYYRRGLAAFSAGALLMSLTLLPGPAALTFAVLCILAAAGAVFLNAYLSTVPAVLKAGHRRRHGSLAGWELLRRSADTAALARSRTRTGRTLVRLRAETW